MRIQVIGKTNEKLLNYFPIDPYADFVIVSRNTSYELQIAFLSIQSAFFEGKYNQKIKTVDLSRLDQSYLERVLKSLYGDQLVIESFDDLKGVYKIIMELQIEEYKINIIQQLVSCNLNPIDLLQFCFPNRISLQIITQMYFDNDLQLLEDQKYYLELKKISPPVMASFLNSYFEYKSKDQKAEEIIMSVLENYCSRKKIEIALFLEDNFQQNLVQIWEKYHPLSTIERVRTQPMELPQKINSSDYLEQKENMKRRIDELQNKVREQQQIIQLLRNELKNYKEEAVNDSSNSKRMQVSNSQKIIKFYSDQEQEQQTTVQTVEKSTNKSRNNSKMKSPQLSLIEKATNNTLNTIDLLEFDCNDMLETPVPNKKKMVNPTQESKNMKMIKARKIFIK